jgi:hypothetical protein
MTLIRVSVTRGITKGYLAVTKVWFCVNCMPPLEVSTRVQKINKLARILVTKGGSYPPNLQGNTSKQQGVKKTGVIEEVVPAC